MRKKSALPLVGGILQKIAPKIGAVVLMEPTWNAVGQITFKNGRRRYFRFSSLDLNSMGASAVAKDKDYANFFMKSMGYPTIPGKTFFSNEWAKIVGSKRNIDAGWKYAQSLTLPVIVKPNSGTQGQGVALVYTKRDFYRAVRAIFRKDPVTLIQSLVKGKDYRIVVLDNRVISAYERVPLHVIGDGRSSIMQLLKRKQRGFKLSGRDTNLKLDDVRTKEKLARSGLSFDSVPAAKECVYLLDNANLSSGGDSHDVTETISPDFRKIAIQLTSDMGLRLCGVDLMIKGDISEKAETYWVLEINSAPGLDHYAKTGKAQEAIVEELYLEVLKSMEQ